MSHKIYLASALAVCALACATAPVYADTVNYDFGSVAAGTTVTPYTLQGATFDSPDFIGSDGTTSTGAFTFGSNGGLYSQLGSSVLSSAGNLATLSISFATAQTGLSFNFAIGDEYLQNPNGTYTGNGADALIFTTNTGYSQTVNLSGPVTNTTGTYFYPQGLFNVTGAGSFTSVTIEAMDGSGEESFAISTLASTAPVPLPASAWFLLSGIGGAAGFARRRRVAV